MEPFLLLAAPLEDNSDSAMRSLWHRHGAHLTFTEMTHVTALARGNGSALRRLQFPDATPCQVQILPSKEADLRTFLKSFSPSPGFRGINFNLGCPSPNVTHAGLGCAMIKRISKVKKMIDIVRSFDIPVSVKLRLGMNRFEKEKKVYLNLIRSCDPDFFVVHARHGKQTYGEPADFSVYDECVATGKKIIANGDVDTAEKIDILRRKGVAGAMIGRAAVRDPAIFDRIRGKAAPSGSALLAQYQELAIRFGVGPHYTKNVLKRLGKDAHKIDEKLLI